MARSLVYLSFLELKVDCFSGHLTCLIKNIKKRVEGQGEESKQAGGKKHESRKREGRDEKHLESESFELALLMSWDGGCVLGRGAGGLILRAGSKAK